MGTREDDPRARNAAADKAIKGLDQWLNEAVAKSLWEKHIWTYEYKQIAQATKLVRALLENVKGPDTRTRE
jgi:hypothetical protein